MTQEGYKRKLAANLSADVEGYGRLMDDDEEATVGTLTTPPQYPIFVNNTGKVLSTLQQTTFRQNSNVSCMT